MILDSPDGSTIAHAAVQNSAASEHRVIKLKEEIGFPTFPKDVSAHDDTPHAHDGCSLESTVIVRMFLFSNLKCHLSTSVKLAATTIKRISIRSEVDHL